MTNYSDNPMHGIGSRVAYSVFRWRVIELSDTTAAARTRGCVFTTVAFGLMALAGLALAQLVAMFGGQLGLASDTVAIVGWSFVGLAALDAALLLVWERLIALITSA